MFKTEKCKIPKIYCGNGDWKSAKPNNYSYYYKKGSPYECMKAGYGSGMYFEKKKNLDENSLQQIPYVGPTYETNFKSKKIKTLSGLYKKIKTMDEDDIQELFEEVFTKSNDTIDRKAINSCILYLYYKGYKNMPKCKKVNT